MEQTWNSDSEPEAETLAAFARRLGVARSTVTRAAQAGRLSLNAQGLVLVQASLASWHASRGSRDDVAQRHAEARGQAIPTQRTQAHPLPQPQKPTSGPVSAPAEAPEGSGASDDADEPTRATYRVQALAAQNDALQIELDRLRGRRLDREQAVREAQGLGNSLRGAVDRLIDQLAPRLAAGTSAADRARLLQRELAEARRALHTEYPRALRRLMQRRGGEASAAALNPPPPEPAKP